MRGSISGERGLAPKRFSWNTVAATSAISLTEMKLVLPLPAARKIPPLAIIGAANPVEKFSMKKLRRMDNGSVHLGCGMLGFCVQCRG